jgi:thiol-disulfide isomerase/thioredoxin
MKIYRAIAVICLFAVATFAFTYVATDVPAIGEQAPEISMQGVDGEILNLSDLKGKVVFIDFWASWCRTCRVENNNISAAYKKYKNQNFDIGNGFEVFAVSLDTDKELWKTAIINDNLSWKYNVSDLQKWKSPVVDSYNFKYLPHNVLIDENGKILAKGLFGNKLDEFLAKHLAE